MVHIIITYMSISVLMSQLNLDYLVQLLEIDQVFQTEPDLN